jgi:RimJ/RimL family protein N-acetyltransferase
VSFVPAIRLELLGARHLAGLSELVDDPEVQRYTRVPSPPPPGFARSWLDVYERGRAEGDREAFAVVDEANAFLGIGLAPRIEHDTGTVELGYVVAAAARGRGVATETLRLLTEWAFADLGAQRIELQISVENDASKRVAERCGYRREGVRRSVFVKLGRREDMEVWSRLHTDP